MLNTLTASIDVSLDSVFRSHVCVHVCVSYWCENAGMPSAHRIHKHCRRCAKEATYARLAISSANWRIGKLQVVELVMIATSLQHTFRLPLLPHLHPLHSFGRHFAAPLQVSVECGYVFGPQSRDWRHNTVPMEIASMKIRCLRGEWKCQISVIFFMYFALTSIEFWHDEKFF